MASNYFPVGLLDQPWDDDSLGTLSSLERRQRKAAEKSDINAFCKFLGIIFITLNLVLLGSELYTFATEPSRGLTGAFLMEIGRMSGIAYGQLQNLYKAVGDIAWTGIAVVHGPDFAQKGVDIAGGTAQLLAYALSYLAWALFAFIAYYTCPRIVRAPMRAVALVAPAACALFGAPPVYSWLVSRICQTRSPEPVVLWALVFSGVMCFGSLSVTRAIRGRSGDAQPSMTRHRGTASSRRQPATGGGSASGGALSGGSGAGASSSAAGGSSGHAFKRCSYSRASSAGRSGGSAAATTGGGGSGTAALADPMQPTVARCGSNVSLTGYGFLSGLSSLSCGAADAVGSHTSVRGILRTCSGSSSSLDAGSSPLLQQVKHGAAAASASASASCARGGDPTGLSNATSTSTPDPCVAVSSKHSGGSSAARGATLKAGSGVSSSSTCPSAPAPTKGSASAGGKQRQQGGGGSSGGLREGADGTSHPSSSSSSVKLATGAASVIASSNQGSRKAAADPSPAASGAAGSGSSKHEAGTHFSSTQPQQHSQGVPPPPASSGSCSASSASKPPAGAAAPVVAPAGVSSSSLAPKKKSAVGTSTSSSCSGGVPAAAASPTSVPASAAETSATLRSAASNAAGATAVGPASAAGGASRPARTEVANSKPAATSAASAGLPASKIASSSAASEAPGPAAISPSGGVTGAGGLLSRLTATVVSVASSSPTSRTVKKPPAGPPAVTTAAAAATARKPQSQQAPSATQPQYIIVPPPPPPPRKSPPSQAADLPAAAPVLAVGTGGTASAVAAAPGNPVRNAWLNPNPVIKLASGMAKGPKSKAAAERAQPTPAAQTPAAEAPVPRGAASQHIAPSPTAPGGSRTAGGSGGGGGGGGVTASDRSVISGRGPAGLQPPSRPPVAIGFGDTYVAASPPLAVGGGGGNAAVCQPVVAAAAPAIGAAPALGVPATAFLPPQAQEQLRNHFQACSLGSDPSISTRIVSSDSTLGTLVAHKHASGDLDIASVAANYLPYPSSFSGAVPPSPGTAVPIMESETADSFSLFSTPPPLITAEAAVDPASVTAVGLAVSAIDADVPLSRGGGSSHMQYGMYGTYTALPSIGVDPVWSHNVPSVFAAAPGLNSSRAPRVPPPGFPSHAYGGVFAAGPFPSGGGGGWDQPAIAVAATTTVNARPDTLPLPPAGENGVLASLGFVDDCASVDGAASGGGGSVGGGDDASCAICWSAPRQVGFLHGKTSHLCVCRRCAAKLREGVHRCPMCRQLIERIIDIY